MHPAIQKHLSRLVGHKITGLIETPEHKPSATPALPGFTLDDGTDVFIFSDAEGNGPGHLDIAGGEHSVLSAMLVKQANSYELRLWQTGKLNNMEIIDIEMPKSKLTQTMLGNFNGKVLS